MNLVKKGRFWWVDYRVNGKRYRHSTGTSDRKAALAWMNSIDVARRMPDFESAVEVLRHFFDRPPEGRLALDAIWPTYERLAKALGKDAVSSDTYRKRRNQVERLISWIREKRPKVAYAEHVTGAIAAGFAEHLAASGLKTKTRRNAIGDLSAVWKLIAKASDGVRNPWTDIAPPDTDGEIGKAFTREQEDAVLEAARRVGKDWHPICRIMRGTGLRYGDVATMDWSEIQGDVIRLEPNKTKRRKIRVAVPMLPDVLDAVRSLERRGEYLFPVHAAMYGHRGMKTTAGLVFAEVLEAAGLKGCGYTIHSWRHTAATRLAERGVDIETRKRILGHTVDATARRYDHDEHLNETRRALEAAASCHSKIGKS